ncbi:hypothetical protein MMC25_001536 [Agyrium rufum]|nr:hypothetical protein [Agyrium rufum]
MANSRGGVATFLNRRDVAFQQPSQTRDSTPSSVGGTDTRRLIAQNAKVIVPNTKLPFGRAGIPSHSAPPMRSPSYDGEGPVDDDDHFSEPQSGPLRPRDAFDTDTEALDDTHSTIDTFATKERESRHDDSVSGEEEPEGPDEEPDSPVQDEDSMIIDFVAENQEHDVPPLRGELARNHHRRSSLTHRNRPRSGHREDQLHSPSVRVRSRFQPVNKQARYVSSQEKVPRTGTFSDSNEQQLEPSKGSKSRKRPISPKPSGQDFAVANRTQPGSDTDEPQSTDRNPVRHSQRESQSEEERDNSFAVNATPFTGGTITQAGNISTDRRGNDNPPVRRDLLDHEADYDIDTLTKMKYSALRDESFDFNPHANAPAVPDSLRSAPIAERVDYICRMPFAQRDNEAQEEASPRNLEEIRSFITSLSIDEFDECGDIILEGFSAITTKWKEVRRENRRMATEFEEEVAKVEERLAGKQHSLEGQFEGMKSMRRTFSPMKR